ncbi:MAG: ferritin-like domain-containing protein [Gordonia sp. (in: high G+C Gram-positive bacteria)]
MSSTTDALVKVIDIENAAIFAYGVSTAFIGTADRNAVGEYIAEHRVQRDQAAASLTALGGKPPVSAAGYELGVDVTGRDSAATVLLTAETDCARAYRALLEQSSVPDIRRQAVDALTGCALRAARWRGVLGKTPVTEAFPGGAS